MGGRFFLFVGFVVAAVTANTVVSLLDFHPEQDGCSFGPVSNSAYRAYLAEAKLQAPVFVPSLYLLNGDELSQRLKRMFESINQEQDNIYKKLAIMHAVLRAAGAEYRNTNGTDLDRGRSDPFTKAVTGASLVSFHYLLDVNRFWIFLPWPRDAWIIAALAGPHYGERPGPAFPERPGQLAFIVHAPDLEFRSFGKQVLPSQSCPPVPERDLVHSFSVTHE